MTQQYGFRTNRNLAEVLNRNTCLDNLKIDRRDLSLLVGTSAAGVTSGDYQNCKGLTSNLESQIITLSALPGPVISSLNLKAKNTGDTFTGNVSANVVNVSGGYRDSTSNVYSTSTSSFFVPITGNTYTGGGQYLLGNTLFPSGVTTSSLNYLGTSLAWNSYYVRHRSYFEVKDSGNTTRYIPLYVAPPSSLPSNVIWLDSEYSQITTSGGAVSAWRDVLSRTTAIQETAANRPTYVASEINDKPCLSFDGTNDVLSLGQIGGALSSGATVIAVFSLTTSSFSGDSDYAILTNLNNANSSWSSGWGLFTSSLVSSFPAAPPVNGTHVVSIRASSTYGLEYRLNGSRGSYLAPTGFTYTPGGDYLIGSRRPFRGMLYALAIYNEVLDDKVLKAQEEYFRWRYGFTAPNPDAAAFSYTKVIHDEDTTPFLLEDDSILEVE